MVRTLRMNVKNFNSNQRGTQCTLQRTMPFLQTDMTKHMIVRAGLTSTRGINKFEASSFVVVMKSTNC